MAEKLKVNDLTNVCVGSSVLQELFGVGDRQIRYLVEQGILERQSHGKYLFLKSVKAYITTLKVAANKSQLSEKEYNELDLNEEKAKHEYVKRQIAEIKLQLIRGEVHKAEDVEAVMCEMLARFKSQIESLPAKLAKKLEGENRTEIQKVLKEELGRTLEELSEYNPNDFYSNEHIEISDDEVEKLIDGISNEGEC